ncbi:MAG TPA: hypothetical protein VJ835_04315 [Fimbriimonadaceae bacterium]|nr:hypothetical protein [Fimbriimonadaceae bacterium]
MILGTALAVVLATVGFLMQEPPIPYGFISKFPIDARKNSTDGKMRVVILKAPVDEVIAAMDAELKSKAIMSGEAQTNFNGIQTRSATLVTPDGALTVSNNLDVDAGPEQYPSLKPGYCTVSYTRPKSYFDRAMEWIQNLFHKQNPKPIRIAPVREPINI